MVRMASNISRLSASAYTNLLKKCVRRLWCVMPALCHAPRHCVNSLFALRCNTAAPKSISSASRSAVSRHFRRA